jgi:hypothetical protein
MNSDLRYHIASLAAVFLALGIGILVGTAFVGAPVVQRQTTLIRRLEENVGDLRRETAIRDNTEKALSALVPGVISGKLSGRQVLVVQSGGYRDATDATVETLEKAGAVVLRVALPIDAWRREMNRDTASLTDPNVLSEAIGNESRELAPLLLRGDPPEGASPLQSYRDRGLLVDNGSSDKGPFKMVVLVGGTPLTVATSSSPDDSALQTFIQQRDLPLIESWSGNGATVVAVEPLEAEVTFLRLYQGSSIATIDAIDHAAGQIALPFALQGEVGNYGLRSTADRVLPKSVDVLRMATPAPPPHKPLPTPAAILTSSPSPVPSPTKSPAVP